MNKFLFKSANADFQKLIQSIDTIQKNVLYLTYRTDTLLKEIKKLSVDKGLQKQVDEYFEQDPFGSAFVESTKNSPPTPPPTQSDYPGDIEPLPRDD